MNSTKHVFLFLVLICSIVFVRTSGVTLYAAGEHDNGHEHAHEESSETARESEEDPYSIHLKTHPKPGAIVPDKDMVELMFEVNHGSEVAHDVDLSYRVYAPPKNFWFGTDFPVVEGTQLLSGTVHLPNGSQVISMILPIRGDYRVKATARGPKGTTTESMGFSVSENPQEVVNLSVFLVILFLIGGVGGFFLSGNRSGTTASIWFLVVLFGSSLFMIGTPQRASAHGEGSWDPHELEDKQGIETFASDVDISVKAFPQPVDVGEMLEVRYQVNQTIGEAHAKHENHAEMSEGHDHEESKNGKQAHEKGHPAGHDSTDEDKIHSDNQGTILTESHFVHSEGGLEMVNQTSWFEENGGSINVQLFDGAPHYLVTRFYRPTDNYAPSGGHRHGHGEEKTAGEKQEHGSEHTEGDEHSEEKEHEEQGTNESKPWEAKLKYHLPSGEYDVKFHESGDPTMKWLMVPESEQPSEQSNRHEFQDCESLEAGSTIPGDGKCYNLELNSDGTSFSFEIPDEGHYELFTQHLPREFDMTVQQNGSVIEPDARFVTGKGQYLGRSVKWIELNAVQPPVDSIVKSLLTLLLAVGLGFFVGYKSPGWLG